MSTYVAVSTKQKDLSEFAGLKQHAHDAPLPSWPYAENDHRKEVAPDSVWEPWKAAQPPLYDPPQFKYGPCAAPGFSCFYFHRAGPPCGCDPCCLCCVPCCNCCFSLFAGRKFVRFSEPEDWFTELLNVPAHENCPEMFKGIWWLMDNPGSETLCTFHQSNWVSPRLGYQNNNLNYCHDAGNVGGALGVLSQLPQKDGAGATRIEIGLDNRWINIGGWSWMYCIQPGDDICTPDGEPISAVPGDFMRASYLDEPVDVGLKATGRHTLTFQYLVRKVAYLDDDGELVLTPAYDELVERATGDFSKTCFGDNRCGFFSLDEIPENDLQTISIGPQKWKVPADDEVGADKARGFHRALMSYQVQEAPEQDEMEDVDYQ